MLFEFAHTISESMSCVDSFQFSKSSLFFCFFIFFCFYFLFLKFRLNFQKREKKSSKKRCKKFATALWTLFLDLFFFEGSTIKMANGVSEDRNLANVLKVIFWNLKTFWNRKKITAWIWILKNATFVLYGRPRVLIAIQFLRNFVKQNKKELVIIGSPIGELCRKELFDD